jgi:hypothetical protein
MDDSDGSLRIPDEAETFDMLAVARGKRAEILESFWHLRGSTRPQYSTIGTRLARE